MDNIVKRKRYPSPDKEKIDQIIRQHVIGAMGIGLIPLPMVDLVALTGIQLNMLRNLSKIYELPFTKDKGKSIIASLLGGVIPVTITGTIGSLVKFIPIVGQTGGALMMPVTGGAITYAVGKVFIQHLDTGGTFLNFDPDEVRAYYETMFKEGKQIAESLKSEKNGLSKHKNHDNNSKEE